MPRLVNCIPFGSEGHVVIRGERIRIRANQIIAWISLTPDWIDEPNPSFEPFPAIVDTGHTHSFSINQRHLIEWAGPRPEAMDIVGAARDRGQRLDLRAANIWAHPNECGKRERLGTCTPIWIQAENGIAIYPDGDFPQLPILGLKAIADNGLFLQVDGQRRLATLRTPIKWWWPFA